MYTHSGGNALPRAIVLAAAFVLSAAALSGCTPDRDAPSPTTIPDVPEPTETSSTIAPTSVVTIAGADVDGTTATVAGYVTQIAEDGGNCEFELTFAVDQRVVSVPSAPAANVGTTSCGTVQIPLDQLAKGTWTVVLHYKSNSLDLVSEPVTMEVP